ncbi:dis3l2 [Symbiodinium necroappetens]|uniref:Dis3l2 protein n=1 Tax=Symbiodinium necroappetens TaxID=1628268 RepID=A0A812YV76_9DINO|nr:dis3l2 [Symbiodinium microadriaticum]CAE7797704.1 dis3l2 [Symbiodinium necroappetens]
MALRSATILLPLAVVVAFLTLAPSFVPAANKVEPSLRGSAVLTSGTLAVLMDLDPVRRSLGHLQRLGRKAGLQVLKRLQQ